MADIDKIEFPDGTQHNIKDSRIDKIEIDPQTLTNGQVLKYDASDDTWKNEDETGGGADYIELTQAQYDLLSYAEKHNGKMYFITDAPSGGGSGSYHEYSTTEQEVGKWVDGKTMYEKTIAVELTSSEHGYSFPGVDTIMFMYASMVATSGGNTAPMSYYNTGSNDKFQVYYKKNTSQIMVTSNGWTGSGYLVVRYTKASS